MAITSVESPTSSKVARTRRVLQHIELHPSMKGWTVKHIHEPAYDSKGESTAKIVNFNEDGKSQGGEHIIDHLVKHGGLPEREDIAHEENEPEEIGETEQEAKP